MTLCQGPRLVCVAIIITSPHQPAPFLLPLATFQEEIPQLHPFASYASHPAALSSDNVHTYNKLIVRY
jgi:hypothetical protein